MTKKLLNEEELEWSAIVANNSMNRKRQSVGVNSYQKDLNFNPIDFLQNRHDQNEISWLDLCCGEGNALIQAAKFFHQNYPILKIKLEGIDLVDFFSPIPNQVETLISLRSLNLANWQVEKQYDLITIVHGLHYVGDKIGLIQKVTKALKANGLFIANLDLENIQIPSKINAKSYLKNYFQSEGFDYSSQKHILKIEGQKYIHHPFQYLGADDEAGKNYTGQAVVDSYYAFE